MHRRTDVIYSYDGSYDGALCCVFAAFERKERPCAMTPEYLLQPTFCEVLPIATDPARAQRVAVALEGKISPRAAGVVQDLFFSCSADKELLMLDFIRLGLQVGSRVTTMLGDPVVAPVVDAVKHLHKEAHNYKGFLRFSDYGGVLVGIIEPKNFVLPLLAPHFCARYREESFLIWDKTHQTALAYTRGEQRIFELESFTPPLPGQEEARMRAMFKQYFETIAIAARENPRCQMTHLPKRFRGQMTEFQVPADSTASLPARPKTTALP